MQPALGGTDRIPKEMLFTLIQKDRREPRGGGVAHVVRRWTQRGGRPGDGEAGASECAQTCEGCDRAGDTSSVMKPVSRDQVRRNQTGI